VHTLQRAIAEGMRAPRRDAPLLARPTLLE
jgi:hypothetical protein